MSFEGIIFDNGIKLDAVQGKFILSDDVDSNEVLEILIDRLNRQAEKFYTMIDIRSGLEYVPDELLELAYEIEEKFNMRIVEDTREQPEVDELLGIPVY